MMNDGLKFFYLDPNLETFGLGVNAIVSNYVKPMVRPYQFSFQNRNETPIIRHREIIHHLYEIYERRQVKELTLPQRLIFLNQEDYFLTCLKFHDEIDEQPTLRTRLTEVGELECERRDRFYHAKEALFIENRIRRVLKTWTMKKYFELYPEKRIISKIIDGWAVKHE